MYSYGEIIISRALYINCDGRKMKRRLEKRFIRELLQKTVTDRKKTYSSNVVGPA